MIRCKTELDKDAMQALTRYHAAHSFVIQRRKNLFTILGVVLIILAVYSAVDGWKNYYGTESLLVIFGMPLVFAALSAAVFITRQKGMEYSLYRELKKYFEKTDIKYIDYVISESGIRINIKGNGTTYTWDMIDEFESDDKYYYFSSKDKYNIIFKESITEKNKELFESLIKNVNKSGEKA